MCCDTTARGRVSGDFHGLFLMTHALPEMAALRHNGRKGATKRGQRKTRRTKEARWPQGADEKGGGERGTAKGTAGAEARHEDAAKRKKAKEKARRGAEGTTCPPVFIFVRPFFRRGRRLSSPGVWAIHQDRPYRGRIKLQPAISLHCPKRINFPALLRA